MGVRKQTKGIVFFCTVLATLVCCQPLAVFFASITPFTALHVDKEDGPDSGRTSLPQGWGIRKTTAPVLRLFSGSLLQAAAVIPHKSVHSEHSANSDFAVLTAQLPVSAPVYLNNLTFRC